MAKTEKGHGNAV